MAKLKLQFVKGSTLVEVLVAFVIVMLVFTFATIIVVQTYQSESGLPLLKGLSYSEVWKNETIMSNSFFDETVEKSGLVYERHITNYRNSKKILQIEIHVFTSRKEQEIARFYYLTPIQL